MKRLLLLAPLFLMMAISVFWAVSEGCHNATSTPIFAPTFTSTPYSPTKTNTLTITPTSTPTNTWNPSIPTYTFTTTPTVTNTSNATSTSTPPSIYSTCTPVSSNPDLIEDFESTSGGNYSPILTNQCRVGRYYATGATNLPNPTTALSALNGGAGPGCTGTSNYAIEVSSGPISVGGWGAYFEIDFLTAKTAYDISGFSGVQFCGKLGPTASATGPATFNIWNTTGGSLSQAVQPAFTTGSWQSYTYPFSGMTGSINLQQGQCLSWTYLSTSTAPIDYYLDNVTFY